jgi:hypothetical protein
VLASCRPAPVLAALVLARLGVVAWLGLGTPHNGWIWYSGGDATEYWTSQYGIAHGWLPPSYIGYGLSVFYAWVPLVGGDSLLTALPAVALFNVLVLGSLSVVLVWALADRLFGRLYAWSATLLWVVSPWLLLRAFTPSFRPRLEQWFLAPHVAGLTDMADFPSTVLVLAAAWATLRACDTGDVFHGVEAGAVAGVLVALKPANGFFAASAAVLLVCARRPRVAAGCAAGIVPALVALAIWKQRGLGHVPLLSLGGHREAAGAVLALSTSKYLSWNGAHWHTEMGELREVAWSVRLLQFLIVAGIVGALRRQWAKGLFLGVWFLLYAVVKGSSSQADVTATSYFRLTEPGLVALVFLLPAIAFLWPSAGRTQEWRRAPEHVARLLRPALAWVVVVALVPLAVVSLTAVPAAARSVRVASSDTNAPILPSLTPSVARRGAAVRLSWRAPARDAGTHVSYDLFRAPAGTDCEQATAGAAECFLVAPRLAATPDRAYVDHPGRGRFVYWVAAAADYLRTPDTLDVMAFGRPVDVRIP